MAKPVLLIAGLGNPGPQYENTRHNAGVWFLEALARRFNIALSADPKHFGLTGRGRIAGEDVRLIFPTTYMNLSGQGVASLANFFKIAPDQILVVHDELDIPPGSLRLKQGGSHGGHNGLKDIDARLGTRDYHRLRIGIGHPGDKSQVTGFVLGSPPEGERKLIEAAVDEALACVEDLVAGEHAKAQNRMHRFKAG
ncbi:MAG: aminoacyl-tRNA hydrolase [Gammaproteobacteria bacterium]|nr:aminoacyl-tRNA hydrolase [Gammaproteobacteria bacterium]